MTGAELVWLLVAVAFVALLVLGRPGALLDRVARRPVTRVAGLLGWAWLGWHFFVRGAL
jgi:hypothetical protein